jgi:hypothetical protein
LGYGLVHRSPDHGQLVVVESRIWSPVSGICTGMWRLYSCVVDGIVNLASETERLVGGFCK